MIRVPSWLSLCATSTKNRLLVPLAQAEGVKKAFLLWGLGWIFPCLLTFLMRTGRTEKPPALAVGRCHNAIIAQEKCQLSSQVLNCKLFATTAGRAGKNLTDQVIFLDSAGEWYEQVICYLFQLF